MCVKAEATENLVQRLSLQLEQQQQFIDNLQLKAREDAKQAELDKQAELLTSEILLAEKLSKAKESMEFTVRKYVNERSEKERKEELARLSARKVDQAKEEQAIITSRKLLEEKLAKLDQVDEEKENMKRQLKALLEDKAAK